MTNKARRMPGAFQTPLERGPNGRYLCRWCKTECAKARQTFCGPLCVFEWKLRTQPRFLREAVWKRDTGICAQCGMDTVARMRDVKKIVEEIKEDQKTLAAKLKELGVPKNRVYSTYGYWDADHILPVEHGGGECGLHNIQTLCFWCHKEKTLAQRKKAEP